MTANANTLEPPSAMSDQYYAMAEAMNSCGAMELAVPFYRQAVALLLYRQAAALLLAERASLQAQLGESYSSNNTAESLPMDELHGLLKAAEVLQQQGQGAAKASQTSVTEASMDVETRITELAEELNRDSAWQVMAGLRVIAEAQGQSLPISGLKLLGKAQMLLGQSADALKTFEAALKQAPDQADLIVNTGAARLANGDATGAATLLRGLWEQGAEGLETSTHNALLRNLAATEQKLGRVQDALQLRLRWLELDPDAAPPARQLQWARLGLEGGAPEAALTLLRQLHRRLPADRLVMQHLADALEQQGEYREASLLYRDGSCCAPPPKPEGITMKSKDVLTRAAEVDQLIATQQLEKATELALSLFEDAPSKPGMLERVLLVLRQSEQWSRLCEVLMQARNRFQLWPSGSDLLMGQGMLQLGRHEQARPFLEQALEEPGTEAWAHHFLGKVLRHAGELDSALAHQRLASEQLPEFAWAPFEAAELLFDLKRESEAVLELMEARRRHGDNLNPVMESLWQRLQPMVVRDQIDQLLAAGEREEAQAMLRKQLLLTPDCPELSKQLAQVLQDSAAASGSAQQDDGLDLNRFDVELRTIELLLDELEG